MSSVPNDYWPCACCKHVKDAKSPTGKRLAKIKMHPPTAKKCRVCGVTYAMHLALIAKLEALRPEAIK